jgi:P-type E1-E2 ATPase
VNAALQGAVDTMLQRWGREAALRCIGLAYKELPAGQQSASHADEQGLVFLGLVGLHDPPRPEAQKAVQALQVAGIRVIMLTGTLSS